MHLLICRQILHGVRRLYLYLLCTGAWVVAVVFLALRMVLPPPPPEIAPTPPRHAPLTRHLALVIVDGLRHDIATDPSWMPHFAAAMERHSSAVVLAGEISMTSSAVLAYGTGKQGGLDQIVFNERGGRTRYQNVFDHARDAGLRLAATGDIAWFTLYRGVWHRQHPDPPGAAMDVDYNDEIFAAAYRFLQELPNVAVFHFVTPDHQAHVHGVFSPGYRAHIGAFDAKLFALLQAIPRDFTVFLTSDHGAADRGNHGSDAPLMRRCPLVAYGPGIVEGFHPPEPIDQVDLAPTFAYLLAVPEPAHGEGRLMTSWLTVKAPEDVRRAVPASTSASWWAGWLALAAVGLGAALLGYLWLEERWRVALKERPWLWSLPVTLLVVSLLATRQFENLPGAWPSILPVAAMVAANVALFVAVVWRKRVARLVDDHAAVLSIAALGPLIASYTTYTRIQCYILVAVVVVLGLAMPRNLLAAGVLAAMWKLTTSREDFLPDTFDKPTEFALASLAAAMLVFCAERLSRRPTEKSGATLAGIAALGALAMVVIRSPRHVPAELGVALWIALPVAAVVLWRRGARTVAEMCGVACFALVGRLPEIFFLLATALIADVVGESLASRAPDGARPSFLVVIIGFAFSLTYLQRIGVQSGLDFTSIDWTAGSFDSQHVGYPRIALANLTKH
ncbi:MAG TPA: alkaline phosphatase family protein, partial [Polyangiaceae bacterium]|nr:alkaline phosphatase family protein [Polyangiaceae bacterium]